MSVTLPFRNKQTKTRTNIDQRHRNQDASFLSISVRSGRFDYTEHCTHKHTPYVRACVPDHARLAKKISVDLFSVCVCVCTCL